jgi:hypothetical protein
MARMEENRNSYRILVGKSEEIRSIGRHGCRWKSNIKIYLEEIGWDIVGMGTRPGSFDHGNIFGSIKSRVSPF